MAEKAPTPRTRANARAPLADTAPDRIRGGLGARGGDEVITPRSQAGGVAEPESPDAASPPPAEVTAPCTSHLTGRIPLGDREAFAAFYEAWFDRCYAMARSLTGRDESFCLDVVQETMLRVARRMRSMDSEVHLGRWMVRATHSSAIDLLRKERRARAREHAAARSELDGVGDVRESVLDDDGARWLAAALEALDDHERALLRLRFAQGATLDAVGHAAGSSGHAAHGRIRRLLSRLRGQRTDDS